MTSGSKLTDLTSLAWTGDINYPSGSLSNVSYQPVGFFWQKTWNGSDDPSVPLPDVFQRHWQKVDIAANVPEYRGAKLTYVERWLLRKARPRRKFQTEHAYTMSLDMWSDAVFVYTWKDFYPPHNLTSRGFKTFRNIYGDGYSATNAWTANDTIALRGKLREKIVGSDFDMGVFLGEGREALDLITNSATRIAKSLRALRRGDLVSAATALGIRPEVAGAKHGTRKVLRDHSRHYSERWLELQYGWLPLVGDAYGGAQALAQQLNNPAVQTYRVRRRKPLGCTVSSSNIRDGGNWGFRGETRAQLIAKLTEVNIAQLNGLLDPTQVLWELTPYSFVVDWFIPIGSYLEARGLDNSVTGTFIETLTKREYFFCFAHASPSPWHDMEVQPQYRRQKISVERTVSSSLSTPLPQFKGLGEVLNWKRAANAISLLTLSLTGGRKPFKVPVDL